MSTATARPPAPRPVVTADLLGRGYETVHGDAARDLVAGRRILVTGAGGSIGSEIARQVHTLNPRAVYLLDHDESAMHNLQLLLHGHGLFDDDRFVLADIRDRAAIHRVMQYARPEIVFHAAAHKHLPLLERYPSEGVKTNVLGTLNVVNSSIEADVGWLVNISTDKAAKPTSVLGATKRLAEMVVTANAGRGMRVASVRFGNVLGSRGSFLEGLEFQLTHGIPVTVTDPDVTRFFMTIPEAAGLVIEAAAMADEGETYVLDMGEPIRIVDLVDRFVDLTAASPPNVQFTGLRPGEKLHEVLLDDAETRRNTSHDQISMTRANAEPPADFLRRIERLFQLTVSGQVDELLSEMMVLLPDDSTPARIESPQHSPSRESPGRRG